MRTEGRARSLLLGSLAVTLAVAAVAALVRWSGKPPEGPVAVVWDRTACQECGMLLSEPAFAAQLHTDEGEVYFFDDPGCLLRYEEHEAPAVHARWFHHLRQERWIPGQAVSFEAVAPTPMGFGLGAVGAGEAGALSLEQARQQLRAQRSVGEGR